MVLPDSSMAVAVLATVDPNVTVNLTDDVIAANMTSYNPGYPPLCPEDANSSAFLNTSGNCIHSWEIYTLDATDSPFNKPILGFISPFLVLFTIITNGVVCIVLMKRNMRTPTNCMLVAMAISDMLTGVWPIPVFIYFYTLGHSDDYVPYAWCFANPVLTDYLPTLFHTASIWLTVALAVQRYIYVCHSVKAKQWCTITNVVKVVLGVYVVATLSQLTRFFESRYLQYPIASRVRPGATMTGCYTEFTEFVDSHTDIYFNFYYWFRVVFIHLIPCTSLVILNALLIMAMRQAHKRRRMLLKQNKKTECRRLKDSNCTTLMLVAVVGLFLLVEFPLGILLMLLVIRNTFNLDIMSETTQTNATLFINLFILLSYPLNFFIYCGMSRQFRETFKRLFVPGAAPLDREHSHYISLATENGATVLPKNGDGETKDTAM